MILKNTDIVFETDPHVWVKMQQISQALSDIKLSCSLGLHIFISTFSFLTAPKFWEGRAVFVCQNMKMENESISAEGYSFGPLDLHIKLFLKPFLLLLY